MNTAGIKEEGEIYIKNEENEITDEESKLQNETNERWFACFDCNKPKSKLKLLLILKCLINETETDL
jgi:hypothetical protein